MLDPDALRRHIRALSGGDDAQRRLAIQALKDVDEPEWTGAPARDVHALVEALEQQLRSEAAQPYVRKEIVSTLGRMGPRAEPAVASLVDLLREPNPDAVREAAAAALGRVGRAAASAVDHLLDLLPKSRPALAVQIVRAVGGIGSANDRVRTALVDLWLSTTTSQVLQAEAAVALCKLGISARGLVEGLTRAVVSNQDAAVRKAAAVALGWCDRDQVDVVPGLLRAAQADKNEDVRQAAAASLARLGLSREQAVGCCSKQLAESSHAETALRLCGEPAVPTLVETLGAGGPAAREKAARILSSLGELSQAAVPALRRALRSADLEYRLAAAKSLWAIAKDADAVTPVLVGLLGEELGTDPEEAESRRRFIQTVIEALRRIGPPAAAAVPALVDKSRDPNRLISESALAALKEIAPGRPNKAGS